jgi:DNA-binding response OmpR family regulator
MVTSKVEGVARRAQTVLVVDDEPALRQVMQRTLRANGYRVLTASDPDEALAICEEHADAIDLFIVDLSLPRMDGKELGKRLARLRPLAGVMFVSGLDHAAVRDVSAAAPFLAKPFSAAAFLDKAREILAKKAAR